MSTTTSAARTSPLKVASASLVGYTLAQTCGAAFAPLIAASLYGRHRINFSAAIS